MNYESECVYEESDDSDSDFTDDEETADQTQNNKLFARFRRYCRRSVDSKWFMYIIMGSIFLNTLSMGIEYHGQPKKDD